MKEYDDLIYPKPITEKQRIQFLTLKSLLEWIRSEELSWIGDDQFMHGVMKAYRSVDREATKRMDELWPRGDSFIPKKHE